MFLSNLLSMFLTMFGLSTFLNIIFIFLSTKLSINPNNSIYLPKFISALVCVCSQVMVNGYYHYPWSKMSMKMIFDSKWTSTGRTIYFTHFNVIISHFVYNINTLELS